MDIDAKIIKYGFKCVTGSLDNMTSFADETCIWKVGKSKSVIINDDDQLSVCDWGLHFSLAAADAWFCGWQYSSYYQRNASACILLVEKTGKQIDYLSTSSIKFPSLPKKLCTNRLKVLAAIQLKDFSKTSYITPKSGLCTLIEHRLCRSAGLDYKLIVQQRKDLQRLVK